MKSLYRIGKGQEKMKRKMISLFLAVALVFSLLPLQTVAAFGAGASDYNAEKALAYAKNHWNDGKGDCVVFVRACVEAGGIPRESGRTYNYTAGQYRNYLVKNNYAEVFKLSTDYYYSDYQGILAEDNQGKIAPGDIILYHCNNKKCPKKDFHMSICNGWEGTNEGKYPGWVTCYAHNTAVNNKVACKIKCSRCGAKKNSITMYAIHFKSEANGYHYPAAPAIKAVKAGSASIRVSWNQVEGADGYKVYRSVKKNSGYKAVKTAGRDTRSWKNTKLTKGKRYYYKVKAYSDYRNSKLYSAYSNRVSAAL